MCVRMFIIILLEVVGDGGNLGVFYWGMVCYVVS